MKLLVLLGLPPLAVVAQAAPTDDPVSLLWQIGVGAIIAWPFLYLWRDERKQRQNAEERERAAISAATARERDLAPLLTRAVEVLDAVVRGVDQTVERVGASVPSRRDWDHALRRVELLGDELSDVLRKERGDGG